jgi:hypothetical protein
MGPRAQAKGAELNHMANPFEDYHAAPVQPLPIVFFDEIAPSVDVQDFVQGLFIEQGAAVLYGESNSGKTFLATDIALHVASGKEWHGRRVEQGGVLYLALEGGQGFRNRVAAWRDRYDTVPSVHFAAVPSQVNLLDPDADTPRVITAAKAAKDHMGAPIKLIVVDTLARAMAGGNENAPDDMGALVANMDAIREATGAMVLFIHHSGKDAAKGARGHSSLRAAIDTEIEVEAGDGTIRRATVVKQREMKKGDVFSFTLEVVEIGENRHGEMVTTCLVQAAQNAAMPSKRARLSGHTQVAMDALHDALGRSGASGFPGVPSSVPSIPEAWWRETFYAKTVGDNQDTKKKAFQRAVADLQGKHLVGVNQGRVWAVFNGTETGQ